MSKTDPAVRWSDSVTDYLPLWALTAVLTPLIFVVTRRHRIGPGRGWQPALRHLALMSLVWIPLFTLMWMVKDLYGPQPFPGVAQSIGNHWAFALSDAQWYVWIALAAHAYYGAREAVAEAREAAELRVANAELAGRLSQVELQALKAQLQPHFLFNTHHAIAGLIRSGERSTALDLLANLSDLLRYALETKEHAVVPLRRELDFARKYLAIQQARFADRLDVQWSVSPDCREVEVPTLLLQPLVENAVHHGVSSEREHNHVHVDARLDDDVLEVRIVNSTVEGTPDRAGFGIGMRNVHARLARLYGQDYTLELEVLGPEQMQLQIRLPMTPNTR
ncbi:MAG: histidine kinase [Deltaproteobacteria bacterium]|nr:histidine kinase [Deltaproteobacteria bacterium]